ncbi:hypothetical protein E3N88_44776 [Mikania micrantha]|uniref:Ubiquitin-like protease family profile domain-containing protein n=1 Tax=Mikania micrantha TaxID=192012 RepID=A0A5N6LBP1_9ASTR|nr:hypothetical protein E3N88_44776 [Mikania micrantha]
MMAKKYKQITQQTRNPLRRKSERIAKNSLGRFTNTEDNPIELDSSERGKGVVKRNSRDNPIKLDSTVKAKGIMKNISKKVSESDNEIEDERIRVKMIKKRERVSFKGGANGKSTLFDSDNDDEQPLSNLRRKVDGSRKQDVIRFKKPDKENVDSTTPESTKKSKGKEKLTSRVHEDIKRAKAKAHGPGREKEPKKLNVPKKVREQNKKIEMVETSGARKWMVLNTRSSPAQLFRCVKLLRDKQKEGVRQMGFGSLLKFNIDGIPSRMAHYVVDRLKSKKMEIIGRSGSLKITPQMIHRLLGVPIGGIKIESIVPLKVLDESVCQWRRQYEGRLIATREIVEKIESAEDEDTFHFRMDFLLLIMTILVECHKNGRVRENILRYITSETDFSKIDWCDYIFESIKSCKMGWSRDDNSSPFNGPLTILTLIYVDGFECKGISVDKKIEPIEFWNKNRLKIREDWEIKHGGFGRGSLKEELLEQGPVGDDRGRIGGTIEDALACVRKDIVQWESLKGEIEKKLVDLFTKNKDNEEIQAVIACYESLLEIKPTWNACLDESADGYAEVHAVLKSLDLEQGQPSGGLERAGSHGEDAETTGMRDVFVKDGVVDLNLKDPDVTNEENQFDGASWKLGMSDFATTSKNQGGGVEESMLQGPSWSLGVSQIECVTDTLVENAKAQARLETSLETEQSESQFCLSLLNETAIQDLSEKTEDVNSMKEKEQPDNAETDKANRQETDVQGDVHVNVQGATLTVGGSAKSVDMDSQNTSLQTGRLNEPSPENVEQLPEKADVTTLKIQNLQLKENGMRGVDLNKDLTKDEETVLRYVLYEDGASGGLFGDAQKNEVNNEVNNQVIDAWVEVLNFEEKYRSPNSPYRLFCRTNVIIDWILNKEGVDPKQRLEKFTTNMSGMIGSNNNLKAFDMVFFPILEFSHYYLLVFELKNPAISVIDNFHESIPLVGVKDNVDYYRKDSPYKVRIKHPKTDEILATQIQKLHIPWATKTNDVDCEVFMMRHMERFMGSWVQFNYGFSTNGRKKKCQLNMLRKKILLHIIRSEVNKVGDVVCEGARCM